MQKNITSSEKEQTIDIYNSLDQSQSNYGESKKLLSKGYKLYDSIYITFLRKQNYSDTDE